MLTPDDRDTLDLLNSLHSLGITEEEFLEYQRERNEFLFHLKTEHGIRLAEQGIDYIPDVENTTGQGIGTALGIIAGVALSFTGIGSALGLATLVAIGASIGYQLGGALDPPSLQQQKDSRSTKEKQARNATGFDTVASLVSYGEKVPEIYTNKDENPNGGVRTTGYLINQRVDTRNGSQKLYQLYVLCSGPIGRIDESKTLLDNQSLSTFFRNEVELEFRLGYEDQLPLSDFPNYSNAVSLSANATVGCDLRSLVESVKIKRKDILAEPELMRNGFDATRRSKDIDFRKNGGDYALFVSKEALRIRNGKRESGFVEGKTLRANRKQVIGISNVKDPGDSIAALPFCFLLQSDGTWDIRENGVTKASSTYARNNTFAIEYLGNAVYYRQNKQVVYVSAIPPVYPARLAVMIFDEPGQNIDADGVQVNNLFFGKNISYNKGRIRPSDTTIIEVAEEDLDKFSPSDVYKVRGKRFQITGKNYNNNTIVVDDVLNLREDDNIFAVWEASFETSRKVNQIDVNVVAKLWARNPRGELIRHGMVFDCFIKSKGQPWQFLQRFYMSNNVDVDMRRSFKIRNLPLNYYQVELRPVEKPNDSRTIEKLGETGSFQSWNVGTIGANTVTIQAQIEDRPSIEAVQKACDFEGIFDDPEDDADMDEDELKGRKRQVCTQQGATLRITTINEIVYGAPNAYPGFVLAKLVLRSSERLSASPTPSFFISKGKIDRIHIAAGTVSTGSTAENTILTMTDLTANFVNAGVEEGDILRNLDEYRESPIVSYTATTIVTQTTLSFTKGDRYLVYRKDSCNYFPDVYLSRLGESYGLGAIFNCDEFVDYPAFVNGNRFARAKRYFWDGKITQSLKINQWAQQEAPASLMLASMIDGMRSLVNEEYTPPTDLFNANNADNWQEQTIDFQKRLFNRLVVSYVDGSDEFKQKTAIIETPDAYHKRVPLYEDTLQLVNTTNRYQAVAAGALLLKSRIIQDRTSDWMTGLYGAYVRPGSLVLAQHIITEWHEERSGVILSVSPQTSGGGYSLEISSFVDVNVSRSAFRAAIKYRASDRMDTNLFCELSDSGTRRVFVAGTTEAPKPGDWIAVGEEFEEKRTFRISSVEPTEAIGQLQIQAIYWNKDILNQNGLYIDGQCVGGASPANSPINDAEMRSWLAGMNTWLTSYTRNTAPSVMNANYMLANAFHDVLGRGGYFPPVSGTSEGQFIGVKACCLAYRITNDQAWLDRAINMANAAVQYLYSPATVPTNTNAVWAGPHWLFISKADTFTKGPIATKPINSGYFDVVVNFTNGEGTIPSGGSTRGELLSNVYRVYPTDAKLLWKNIFAPVIFGSEQTVQYWVSNYMLSGQRYRVFPETESSAGTLPVVTTEAAGKIKLNSNFTGQLKVCYVVYEPGAIATRNARIEAYPIWRLTQPTEINIATDTLPWGWESYDLLYKITRDAKWLRARNATAYTAIQAAGIANLSHYYKVEDNPEPFSYPGSQMVIVNRSANSVTASRSNASDKLNWLRLDIPSVAPTAYPSVEVQNFAVQTQITDDVKIQVQAAISTPTLLEIVLSLNPDAFNFTQLYKAYLPIAGGNTPVTKRFEPDDFINWESSINKGNILWHPAIADNPVYTYQGSGATASHTLQQVSLGGISPVVSKITLNNSSGGFAGAGFVISLGAPSNQPPCLYFKHEGDNASLRVTDASGRKWETSISDNDGWVRREFEWSDLRRVSDQSGDDEPNDSAPIQSVEIQVSGGESTTYVYYLAKNASVRPDILPTPCLAYKAAIVSKVAAAHTLWVGNFRAVGNPLDILPYTPGIFPFTYNLLTGNIDSWRGVPYVGYQSPAFWQYLGLSNYVENSLRFISDAQDSYFQKTGIDFAASPVYSWKFWDAGEYTKNNGGFGFDGPDVNTGWGQYWYRPLQETALAWHNNPSLAIAPRIVMRSLTYLKSLYETNQSGQPPTNILESGAPAIRYHDPAAAALILRAALYANLAGGDPEITYPVIEWSYKYLRSQWNGTAGNPNFGSFTNGQPTFNSTFKENFGFWIFEECIAIAELIKYRSQLNYPC